MLINRFRLQEAALDDKGGGGDDKNQQQQAANTEWLKPFGEHAKAFEGVKDAADLATRWTATTAELKTLKEKGSSFDFKKELGGEDEAVGKLLARYTDGKAVGKALLEAQTKIRTGDFAKPLAKDAKPEEVTAWRAANGIPEKAEGYFEKLPDGLVIGKDDQPFLLEYGKILHEHNGPPTPELMHKLLTHHFADQEAQAAAVVTMDKTHLTERTSALKEAWGAHYQDNVAITMNHLEGLGTQKNTFLTARMPDGRLLVNSPEIMQFLASQARAIDPTAGLMPPGSEGNIQSLDTEIADIEKLMRTDRKAYNADTKKQERLRQLYDARTKLQARK